jgi:hypothetical protein
VYRTVVAVMMLALPLVACGADPAPVASPERETLLARAGDSLMAIDARSGRVLQRVALGANDPSFTRQRTTPAPARRPSPRPIR